MDESKILEVTEKNREQIAEVIEKLLSVTKPGAVFSAPIEAEGSTVITASEVMVGMGVGYGIGQGTGMPEGEPHYHEDGEECEGCEECEGGEASGIGGGGGGGGGANGRPVAVVSVNKYGVDVEPVVDVTKVALGFFAAFASMMVMFASMRTK